MPRSLIAALLCVPLLAGCGGDDDDDGAGDAGGGATTTAETTPAETAEADLEMTVGEKPLRFDRKSYTAEAGDITISFSADTRIGHNVRVQPADKPCCTKHDRGGTDTVSDGQTATATVSLKPGKYTLYCSLGGHWQGGMVADLRVE